MLLPLHLSWLLALSGYVTGLSWHGRFNGLSHRRSVPPDSFPWTRDAHSLSRRDDHTCTATRACGNGACCGASGYCGFGPIYCGDGCMSNCDAKASCGEYADPVNKTCPLNTCCSEFGFCGTTEEFCNDSCQSNCVLHPDPPGGSPKGNALSKVIGYYEAWSDRSQCHQTSPSDLPLDALTHLNYAFAYIDPSTFKLMTMDAATPVSLFNEIAALKLTKSDLKIYVSVGGWTFSDNNTDTQPVFGNIAKSSSNRKKFSKNVLAFLDQYGFDGVDMDWEYPGAGDRGGKEEDTDNYVKMLKELRNTFDDSGRDLGITFTAPSSYWYMRWFDLPGMLKYADWMNLMSYDLHGVWDSNNPIGSIVQAHTNLTEIKLAAELLWRAKVKPSQVAMGFGFYGRAFTLQDPGCTKPGCPFASGANPGVCTDTSGYLSYYEVQQILSKDSKIKVIHDKDAAVKYFTWDSNQWISYDDKDTFEQKTKWANDIGFSGSLIWASDLDDYKWTAHKALTGKDDLGSGPSLLQAENQKPLVETIDAELGAGCFKFKDTVDLENPQVASCSPYTMVGYDKNGCKGKDGTCGKPVCCPSNSGLKNCQWRGGPAHGDCNGQCHAGEVKLTTSSWGGTPGQSGTGRCGRGSKALCCEMSTFDDLTDVCHWTSGKGKSCKSDEEQVAHMWDKTGWGTVFSHGNAFCCPNSSPVPFKDCHWVGKGDCADNTCNDHEVTLMTDNRGDSYTGCAWGRKKALCCTPNQKVLQTLTCDTDLCEDNEDACDSDLPEDTDGYYTITKRDSYKLLDGRTMWTYASPTLEVRAGVKPGDSRTMKLLIDRIMKTSIYNDLKLVTREYPPGRNVFKGDGKSSLSLVGGYSMLKDTCDSVAVKFTKLADLPKTGFHAEHLQEFQMIPQFLETALNGVLPGGKAMKAAKLAPDKLIAGWNKVYSVTLPTIGEVVTDVQGWVKPLTPNERVFEILGSYAYRTDMSFVEKQINLIKKSLFAGANPMAAQRFKKLLEAVSKGDQNSAKMILGNLQKTIGVFNYINDAVLRDYLDMARAKLMKEFQLADEHMPELQGIHAIWKEFEPAFYAQVVQFAQDYVNNRLLAISQKFPLGGGNVAVRQLVYEAQQLSKSVHQIKFPLD